MKSAMMMCLVAVAAVGCDKTATEKEEDRREAQTAPADNTERNVRDQDGTSVTPGDQSESEADRKITQDIRKNVMDVDDLSANAKNVKIVTVDGVVTLRGPVASDSERDTIAKLAKSANGVKSVDNQLEVAAN